MSPRPTWPRRALGVLPCLLLGALWRFEVLTATNHYPTMPTTAPADLTNTDILARQAGRAFPPYTLREEGGQLVARSTRTGDFLAAADLPASQRRYNAVRADVCRMAEQALRPR